MKNLGKALTASAVMFFATSMVIAQGDGAKSGADKKKENFEKIEAAKKEYFTQELKLTDKEAEKFWPVHDEFSKADRENRKKQREIGKELRHGFDSIPEKDVRTKMETMLNLESADVQIKKDYLNKAADVIGYKRAAKSLHLEHEFKRELMDRVKDKEHGKGPNPGRGEFRKPPVEEAE